MLFRLYSPRPARACFSWPCLLYRGSKLLIRAQEGHYAISEQDLEHKLFNWVIYPIIMDAIGDNYHIRLCDLPLIFL